MDQGIFFEPGEGIALSARGSSMRFMAVADTTGGTFSLMDRQLPVSNRRPQPHRHQGPEGFMFWRGRSNSSLATKVALEGRGFGLSFRVVSLIRSEIPVNLQQDF